MRYSKFISDQLVFLWFCIINLASCATITYDASSSLTISKSLASPLTSIVIITKKSVRIGDTFAFHTHAGPNPRIFMVKRFNSAGKVTIPPLFVPAAEELTFHYATVATGSIPRVTANPKTRVFDFPIIGDDFTSFGNTFAEVPNTATQKTHISTLLLQHDLAMNLYCTFQIKYGGLLRAVYFNDNFRGDHGRAGPHGAAAPTTQSTFNTPVALLKKNELTLVTFIGYRLRVDSFSIITCLDSYPNGNTQSPTLTYFNLQTPIPTPPDTYSVVAPTGSCPPYATRCANENWALQCQENYFRYDHVCQRLCNNTGKAQSNFIHDCTSIMPANRNKQYFYLENYASSTGSRVRASIDIDLPPGKRLIYHQSLMTTNYWGGFNLPISLLASTFSAFETKSIIVSVPQAGMLNFDQTFKMIEPASNLIIIAYVANDEPNKNLMIHLFQSEPTTPAILNSAGILFDITALGEVYTYPSNQYGRISTYLECPSGCKITFYTSGHIKLVKNDRTILFDYDIGSVPTNISHNTIFSGFTFISFFIKNSGTFALYLEGINAKAITHGYPSGSIHIAFDTPTPDCTSSWNCENCLDGVCLSCPSGYYLTPTGRCLASCPSGLLVNRMQRTCESTCPLGTVQASSTECTIACAAPRKYFIPDQGCVGDCPPGCLVCGSGTFCVECHPITKLVSGSCISDSYLQISGSENISSCTNQVFTASINPDEERMFQGNLKFDWKISSTSMNQTKLDELSQLAAATTSANLMIPSSLLEPNQAYTIECSYQNPALITIYSSITASTSSDLIPTIRIDGNARQEIYSRDKLTILKTFAQYSNCLSLSEPFDIQWTQTSGPILSMSSMFNPQVPLWLQISNCSLEENSVYEFQIEVKLTNFPEFFSIAKVQLKVNEDRFYAQMNYGNRKQPYTQDLLLIGLILYEIDCANIDNSGITYTWSCQVAEDSNSEFYKCPDLISIFDIPSSDQELVIPSSYLNENQVLMITLTVTKDSRSASQTSQFSISGSRTFIIEISCTNSKGRPCITWNLNSPITLSATLQGESYNPLLLYEWTIDPPTQVITYQNILRVLANPNLDYSQPNVKVDVSIKNKTHGGDAFASLAINTPPQFGLIEVSPSSGESLSTDFYVNTYNWTDEDAPLAYQFYYSYNSQDPYAWKALSMVQNLGYISTLLTAQAPGQIVFILASVSDSFQYASKVSTNVTVVVKSSILQESLLNMNDLLDSLSPNDPYENFLVASHITSELSNWESKIQEVLENGNELCPMCSFHGFCLADNNTCICDPGWTLPDCSLPQEVFDKVIAIKETSMTVLNQTYNELQTNEIREMLLNTLESFSNSPIFNTIDTIKNVQDILETTLGIGNGTLLTEQESRIVANITNNLIEFSKHTDCNCSTVYCQQLENKTTEYLDDVSQSNLQEKIPGEPATVIETDLFDVITAKTTPCTISNLTLNAGSDTPEVRLTWEDPTNLNCSQELAVKLYAFKSRGDIFDCEGEGRPSDYKTNVMIKVTDFETGKDITERLNVHITMPGSLPCPPGCTFIQDKPCFCKLSLFDVKSQMADIFRKSDLGKVLNFGSLKKWEWHKSPMFWVNVGLTLGFSVAIVLSRTTLKSFCVFCRLIYSKEILTYSSGLVAAFLISNRLTNSLFFRHPQQKKETRVILYYVRLILYATYSALFAKVNDNQGVASLLKNMQIYVVIFPYVSVVPLNLLIDSMIVDTPQKVRGVTTKQSILKKLILYIICFLIIIGCIISMFVIAAQKTQQDQLSWLINLCVLIFQDMFIIPVLTIITQYILMLLRGFNPMRMNKGLHAKSLSFVDRELEDIFEGIKTGKIDGWRFLSLSEISHADFALSNAKNKSIKIYRATKYQKIEANFVIFDK